MTERTKQVGIKLKLKERTGGNELKKRTKPVGMKYWTALRKVGMK